MTTPTTYQIVAITYAYPMPPVVTDYQSYTVLTVVVRPQVGVTFTVFDGDKIVAVRRAGPQRWLFPNGTALADSPLTALLATLYAQLVADGAIHAVSCGGDACTA